MYNIAQAFLFLWQGHTYIKDGLSSQHCDVKRLERSLM